MTAGKADSELIEVRPDERLDSGPLGAWLRDNLDGAEGPFEYSQFGGGHANLTYLLRFGDNEFVLRRPPLGPVAASAHDMSREHRVLSVLWQEFNLAPRCYLLCTDHDVIGADFMVMERRNGFVIRKDLAENLQGDPVLARRIGEMIIDCLARFHKADPAAVGLGAMGRPEGFAQRQLEGWTGRWQAAKDQDIPAMNRLTAWLADNLPEPQAATFVHNDYKLDNMLVAHDDPARAVAVLDWDMCTRGDPLMDLGYLLTYWPEAGDPLTWRDSCPSPLWRHGFPTRAEAVQRYAELSGLDLGHIAWYHAWGTFKIAVVIQQIYIRWRRGQTQDERFAVMGERVRILIDKGCKIAGVSGVSGGIDGDSSSNGTGPAVQ